MTGYAKAFKESGDMFFSDAELHVCVISAIGATAQSRGTDNKPGQRILFISS